MNPDRLAELEDERRFLLRSLRDLDAEHAAGDVDDARLRDAARRLHQAGRRRVAGDRRGPRRAAGGAAAQLVAAARGRRRGRRGRGGSGMVGGPLVGPAARRPGDHRRRGGDRRGDVAGPGAGAARRRPAAGAAALRAGARPSAPTTPRRSPTADGCSSPPRRARATRCGRRRSPRPSSSSNDAVAADETYADPHCFLAVIAANAEDDAATARTEVDDVPRPRPTGRCPRLRRGVRGRSRLTRSVVRNRPVRAASERQNALTRRRWLGGRLGQRRRRGSRRFPCATPEAS